MCCLTHIARQLNSSYLLIDFDVVAEFKKENS